MLPTDYSLQQLEAFSPARTRKGLPDTIFNLSPKAQELKRFLRHFRSLRKAALYLTFISSMPTSDSRATESRFQPRTHLENKRLKNHEKGTILKNDTSFCALFRRISLKGGETYLLIHFGGNHPNIKVR
jgi:hypothetical protein